MKMKVWEVCVVQIAHDIRCSAQKSRTLSPTKAGNVFLGFKLEGKATVLHRNLCCNPSKCSQKHTRMQKWTSARGNKTRRNQRVQLVFTAAASLSLTTVYLRSLINGLCVCAGGWVCCLRLCICCILRGIKNWNLILCLVCMCVDTSKWPMEGGLFVRCACKCVCVCACAWGWRAPVPWGRINEKAFHGKVIKLRGWNEVEEGGREKTVHCVCVYVCVQGVCV